MKTCNCLILILNFIPVLSLADNVVNESETSVSINPSSMSHLGITVDVSQQIEPKEEFIEPDPNAVPTPQPNPMRTPEDRAAFESRTLTGEAAQTNVHINRGGSSHTKGATTPVPASATQTQKANATDQPYQPANYQQQSGGFGSPRGRGPSNGNPTISSPTAPNIKSKVVQGFLYNNDPNDDRDKTPNDKKDSRGNSQNQTAIAPNTNPQTTVTKAAAKKKNNDTGTVTGASENKTPGAALFGRFSNGGKPTVNKAQASSPGAAEQAVKKMWKGYHSASGSRGRKSSRYSGGNSRARSKRGIASALPNAKKLRNPKSIMEAHLRNKWNRGIASVSSGFSDKNIFLFSSMCQHYQSYAQENGINNGKTKCPVTP